MAAMPHDAELEVMNDHHHARPEPPQHCAMTNQTGAFGPLVVSGAKLMTASILAAASERIQPLVPALVIFGRDESGKPHASWFNSAETELATKAAGLMKMRLLTPPGQP